MSHLRLNEPGFGLAGNRRRQAPQPGVFVANASVPREAPLSPPTTVPPSPTLGAHTPERVELPAAMQSLSYGVVGEAPAGVVFPMKDSNAVHGPVVRRDTNLQRDQELASLLGSAWYQNVYRMPCFAQASAFIMNPALSSHCMKTRELLYTENTPMFIKLGISMLEPTGRNPDKAIERNGVPPIQCSHIVLEYLATLGAYNAIPIKFMTKSTYSTVLVHPLVHPAQERGLAVTFWGNESAQKSVTCLTVYEGAPAAAQDFSACYVSLSIKKSAFSEITLQILCAQSQYQVMKDYVREALRVHVISKHPELEPLVYPTVATKRTAKRQLEAALPRSATFTLLFPAHWMAVFHRAATKLPNTQPSPMTVANVQDQDDQDNDDDDQERNKRPCLESLMLRKDAMGVNTVLAGLTQPEDANLTYEAAQMACAGMSVGDVLCSLPQLARLDGGLVLLAAMVSCESDTGTRDVVSDMSKLDISEKPITDKMHVFAQPATPSTSAVAAVCLSPSAPTVPAPPSYVFNKPTIQTSDLVISLGILSSHAHCIVTKGSYAGELVSVKRVHNLSTAAAEGLSQTVSGLISLQHPRIVRLYGCYVSPAGEQASDVIIISQFLSDGCLSDSTRVLSLENKYQILADVCATCSYMHSAGFVHGHLMPNNVLLSRDTTGRWHGNVSDFGVSNAIAAATDSACACSVYTAPEANAAHTTQGDVFAVAMLAYSLLCDEPLTPGQRPQLSGSLDSGVESVLSLAWSTDPLERPSLGELRQVFQKTALAYSTS